MLQWKPHHRRPCRGKNRRMKIKRLTNRSNFFSVMNAISLVGFSVKRDIVKGKVVFHFSWLRRSDAAANHDIYEERIIESKDVIEWLNLQMEDYGLIPREEPEP